MGGAGATWAVTDFGLATRSSVLAVINNGPS